MSKILTFSTLHYQPFSISHLLEELNAVGWSAAGGGDIVYSVSDDDLTDELSTSPWNLEYVSDLLQRRFEDHRASSITVSNLDRGTIHLIFLPNNTFWELRAQFACHMPVIDGLYDLNEPVRLLYEPIRKVSRHLHEYSVCVTD
jgi:hypothetical protein